MNTRMLPAIVMTAAVTLMNATSALAAMNQSYATAPSVHATSLDAVVAAVRSNPNDLNLRRQLAQVMLQNGLAGKAAEQVKAVILLGGLNADDLTLYGDACRYSADYANAAKSYKSALRLSPMSAKAWSGLALTFGTSGDLENGMQVCQHGLAQIADPSGRQELLNALSTLRSMQLSKAANATAAVSITQ